MAVGGHGGRFQRLWDVGIVGVVVADADGRFKEANDAFLRIIGRSREELASGTVHWRLVTPPEWLAADEAANARLRETGELLLREKEYVRRDGTRVPVLVGGAVLDDEGSDTIGFIVDITERKRADEALARWRDELEHRVLERTAELREANEALRREVEERKQTEETLRRTSEQLRHAQKMEAVGRFAGGVAHDFNNLLCVILASVQMSMRRIGVGDPVRPALEDIAAAGKRGADLTRQLLAFTRQQVLKPKTLDVSAVVLGMQGMLPRLLGEDIDLRVVVAAPVWTILADPGQIEQIVMNLAVNARDAMPGGGTLVIEIANVERDGPHVMLAVTDDGVGMDEATLARIFDPFFTTKERGKGTGLGLSTVHGIVEQSGGHLRAESAPGKGARFEVWFPRVTEAPPAVRAASRPAAALGGKETILLVEDEDAVRRVAAAILRYAGYEVLAAASAEAAMEIFEQRSAAIHLLLTDVVMPKMSGPELAARLASARPDLRILFMSGYANGAVPTSPIGGGEVAFLEKPFQVDLLLAKVREVLG